MSTLANLQNQFQNYLLNQKAGIQKAVVKTEKLPIQQRLEIYLDAYRYRLVDSLAANFPMLTAYLGFEEFSALANDYIDKFPSPYRSIRWYGDTFPVFLREESEPYLAELAEFEWKMTLCFDAANKPLLTIEEMAALSPESWAAVTFIPHPSLHLMHFQWNVVALWEALIEEKKLPSLENEEAESWVLWRKEDYLNHFYCLGEEENWMLAALVEGKCFGELCEGLCRWYKEEEVGMQAASFLKGWIQSGMLVGGEDNPLCLLDRGEA